MPQIWNGLFEDNSGASTPYCTYACQGHQLFTVKIVSFFFLPNEAFFLSFSFGCKQDPFYTSIAATYFIFFYRDSHQRTKLNIWAINFCTWNEVIHLKGIGPQKSSSSILSETIKHMEPIGKIYFSCSASQVVITNKLYKRNIIIQRKY